MVAKKIPLLFTLFFLVLLIVFSFFAVPKIFAAYEQANCGSGDICYDGTPGADIAPGYQCGDAQNYKYDDINRAGSTVSGPKDSDTNNIPNCDDPHNEVQGLCCVQGSSLPPLPDHTKPGGGSYSLGGNCTNTTSICYDGDTGNEKAVFGNQCGSLVGWHFGKDGSGNAPHCNSGFCCDPGAANYTPPPPNPCPSENGICTKIDTAIGTIDVSGPGGFIGAVFGILLSLAGGTALILIILSGYQIMVAQGDPEKVKAAQERLTSAIIGLLFMIFSVTILQILGVDILHIPGFGK